VTSSRTGRPSAREINQTVRYTCWTVYRRTGAHVPADAAAALEKVSARAAERDVQLRGLYDVSGLRGDADLLVWLHGPDAAPVQHTLHDLRASPVGPAMAVTWSAMGVHRPAEFNKGHVPAFMSGHEPRAWLSVYPFVRSYEWYLLPEQERREMLVEHGMMGREYSGVLSNTVAAFALGDYEWLLALESDELFELVDMMRHLRASKARRHVREETPFFTGRRVDVAEALEVLR
jgi:chlorite dismutase